MHKLLFLAVFILPLTATGGIYKSVDDKGNVSYSDEPSPGAVEIKKREIPTMPSVVPEVDLESDTDTEADDDALYSSIEIVNPEPESSVRDNAGNLSVSVALQPSLKETHSIMITLDGEEVANSRSPVFQFQNLDRGTHTLTAIIVNAEGNEVQRSSTITFTMQRHSELHRDADIPGTEQPPAPDGPTPTNPPKVTPSGQNPVNPSFPGPTPTNPPRGNPGS